MKLRGKYANFQLRETRLLEETGFLGIAGLTLAFLNPKIQNSLYLSLANVKNLSKNKTKAQFWLVNQNANLREQVL